MGRYVRRTLSRVRCYWRTLGAHDFDFHGRCRICHQLDAPHATRKAAAQGSIRPHDAVADKAGDAKITF